MDKAGRLSGFCAVAKRLRPEPVRQGPPRDASSSSTALVAKRFPGFFSARMAQEKFIEEPGTTLSQRRQWVCPSKPTAMAGAWRRSRKARATNCEVATTTLSSPLQLCPRLGPHLLSKCGIRAQPCRKIRDKFPKQTPLGLTERFRAPLGGAQTRGLCAPPCAFSEPTICRDSRSHRRK